MRGANVIVTDPDRLNGRGTGYDENEERFTVLGIAGASVADVGAVNEKPSTAAPMSKAVPTTLRIALTQAVAS